MWICDTIHGYITQCVEICTMCGYFKPCMDIQHCMCTYNTMCEHPTLYWDISQHVQIYNSRLLIPVIAYSHTVTNIFRICVNEYL